MTYHLLSRIVYLDTVEAILGPGAAETMICFMQEKSKPVEMLLKIDSLTRLNGNNIHGLLGRGSGDFAHRWFFIPGTHEKPYYLSTIVVTVPFKSKQSVSQLKLTLEAAVMKIFKPTPA